MFLLYFNLHISADNISSYIANYTRVLITNNQSVHAATYIGQCLIYLYVGSLYVYVYCMSCVTDTVYKHKTTAFPLFVVEHYIRAFSSHDNHCLPSARATLHQPLSTPHCHRGYAVIPPQSGASYLSGCRLS